MIGLEQILDVVAVGSLTSRTDREVFGLDEDEAAHLEFVQHGIDAAAVHKVGAAYAESLHRLAPEMGLSSETMATCAFAMGFLAGVQAEQARA